MMFPDGFDAFWALQTPIWVLSTLCEASRGLVACKGGAWGLSRFRASWGEKWPEKKSFQMCLGILWGGIYDVFGWF